jgi:predicted phosphodiesterase
VQRRGPVLYVNPGSAGPRRFRLPVSVAQLRIERGQVTARIVELSIIPPA